MTSIQILEECKEVQKAKQADYVSQPNANPHENFQRSAIVSSWFRHDRDKAYVVLIGTKLARLAALLSDDRTPVNESIKDSFIDLTNYCSLWAGNRLSAGVINTLGSKEKCYFCSKPFDINAAGLRIEQIVEGVDSKFAHSRCYQHGTLFYKDMFGLLK